MQLIPKIPQNMKLNEQTKQTEHLLRDFLCNFISTLLIVPVSNCHSCLFLFDFPKMEDMVKCKDMAKENVLYKNNPYVPNNLQ